MTAKMSDHTEPVLNKLLDEEVNKYIRENDARILQFQQETHKPALYGGLSITRVVLFQDTE